MVQTMALSLSFYLSMDANLTEQLKRNLDESRWNYGTVMYNFKFVRFWIIDLLVGSLAWIAPYQKRVCFFHRYR